MVEKFRGRIEFKSLERIRIELVLLSLSTDLLFDDIRKVAKIIAKTECFKYLKNYYLDVQHLIHFDYHDLLVATLISPMSKWRPLQHASCTLPIRFVFPVWKWGAKKQKKKSSKFICKQLAQVLKIYCFINFPSWWYQGSVI